MKRLHKYYTIIQEINKMVYKKYSNTCRVIIHMLHKNIKKEAIYARMIVYINRYAIINGMKKGSA